MGTFAYYTGGRKIKNKKEFTQNLLKILYYGGMMKVEEVNMFGHKIILLRPVKTEQEAENFHYNYFEDAAWESAGYDSKSNYFGSGKIGDLEFNDVITAAYMLYEKYDEEPGNVMVDGDVIRHPGYTGWLNQVLGTQFSMKNRFRIWENVEKDALSDVEEDRSVKISSKDILKYIPAGCICASGGTELTDLLYIANGTYSLTENTVEKDTYPADVLNCKKALMSYFNTAGENGEMELLELVKMKREDRITVSDTAFKPVADLSLYMPARVFLYLTAEIKGKEFWPLWKEQKDCVYHDEEMKSYASDELTAWREAERNAPIEPLATSKFLIQDSSLIFWDTPDDLKNEPNYYITDADRLYWWDGSDEVRISEETDAWLKELAKQHRELTEHIEVKEDSCEFLQEFLVLLEDICNYYARIFPFQTMFYDFLQNSQKKEYAAAVELLKNMADDEENRKIGDYGKYGGSSWYMTSRNVTHNRARIKIKRYLSVMANRKLREKYFGF